MIRRSVFSLGIVFLLALSGSFAQAQHIVIDPGHGGSDPGGTGTGMQEKEVVLDISLRFRDLLHADTADTNGGGSWQVSLTRDTDVFIPLAARSAYANSQDADRFMSIHANAFSNTSANGTETFSHGSTGNGASLRNLVQEEMIAAWGLTNRGNKTANFSVLSNTAMPAELHELGFITNATDAAKLASDKARQSAAVAHLRALQRHYSIEPYLPEAVVQETSGRLLVAVLDTSGAAVVNAEVRIDGEQAGSSDEQGELFLEDLTTGEHLVTVSALGFRSDDQSIQLEATEIGNVLFELQGITEVGEDPQEDDPACDSPTPNCSAPTPIVDGGCSASGNGSGSSFALLLLALTLGLARKRLLCEGE